MSARAQRLVGTLGIAYVLVTFAPAFFLPPPPPGGVAAAEIASYYVDHQDALLVAGWAGLLAFPLGFAFVAGLLVLLRGDGPAGDWLTLTAALGISVTLAVAAVQGILALAIPYVARSASAEMLKLLADITQLGFSVSFVPAIAYFAATGLLVLRSGVLPAWLGYAALAAAAGIVVASLGAFVRSGPLAAGGAASLVGLVVVLGWWLAAAIALVLRPRASSSGR